MVPKVQNAKRDISLSSSIDGKVQGKNVGYSMSPLAVETFDRNRLF
jgi:hypothetical protein